MAKTRKPSETPSAQTQPGLAPNPLEGVWVPVRFSPISLEEPEVGLLSASGRVNWASGHFCGCGLIGLREEILSATGETRRSGKALHGLLPKRTGLSEVDSNPKRAGKRFGILLSLGVVVKQVHKHLNLRRSQ